MLNIQYPLLHECLTMIKSSKIKKQNFINNIIDVNDISSHNTLIINDYEATCKITPYLITDNTPLKTTDTTECISMNNATHVFNIVVIILDGLNYEQVFSENEYYISMDMMIELVVNVHNFVNNIYYYNGLNNPYNNFALIFTDFLNDTYDDKKYEYLNTIHMTFKLTCSHTDTKVKEVTDSFRFHFDKYKRSTGIETISDTNSNRLIGDGATRVTGVTGVTGVTAATANTDRREEIIESDESDESDESEEHKTIESLLIKNETEKFKFSDYITDNSDNGNEEENINDIKPKTENILVA